MPLLQALYERDWRDVVHTSRNPLKPSPGIVTALATCVYHYFIVNETKLEGEVSNQKREGNVRRRKRPGGKCPGFAADVCVTW
jgi:hypothetical protein